MQRRSVFLTGFLFLGIICFTQQPYDSFKLTYLTAGLGSNMGSMLPTFRVTGNKFVYTLEQNSFYGKPDNNPETICTGMLRNSSIDSILSLVRGIKDSVVFNYTATMSGVMQYVLIKYEKINVTFKMHNAFNPVAGKIVDILNSNIPANKEKLWLSHLRADD